MSRDHMMFRPAFLLVADEISASLVEQWASHMATKEGMERKVEEALYIAEQMRAFSPATIADAAERQEEMFHQKHGPVFELMDSEVLFLNRVVLKFMELSASTDPSAPNLLALASGAMAVLQSYTSMSSTASQHDAYQRLVELSAVALLVLTRGDQAYSSLVPRHKDDV